LTATPGRAPRHAHHAAGYGGNQLCQWSRRGKAFQAVPSFHFPKVQWHGEHEIRVGADIDYRSFFGTTLSHPIQLLRPDNSLAQQINFAPATSQAPSDTSVAEFLQDHWVLDSHWSVDLGARISSETTGWPFASAPRAGVAYSPGKSGKTVIRAGAGIFFGVLPLLAANFAANQTAPSSRFPPPACRSARRHLQQCFRRKLNPLTAPAASQPSTTPRNVTWNSQIEHELRRIFIAPAPRQPAAYLFVNQFTSQRSVFEGRRTPAHCRELEARRYSLRRHDESTSPTFGPRARPDIAFQTFTFPLPRR
jgi:hypothetical protein